jgi:hypothetical protein
MSTLLQIVANRRNSRKSTGPRSVEGKAVSRMNALKSGIDARSNIIRGEDPSDLQGLTNFYYKECQPASAQEQFYVDILIRNDWQLRRMERVDSQYWEYHLQGNSTPMPGRELGRGWNCGSAAFARLQRRKNDIQRSSLLARQELKKLQAERPAAQPSEATETAAPHAQIGFVPTPGGRTPPSAPDPPGPATTPFPPTPEAPAPQIGFVPQTGPLPPAARQSPLSQPALMPACLVAGVAGTFGCLWGR